MLRSKKSPSVSNSAAVMPHLDYAIPPQATDSLTQRRYLNKDKLKEFGRFLVYRQTAWIEWGTGITAGNALAEAGMNRYVASLIVMSGVAATEYAQTKYESTKRAPLNTSETEPIKHKKVHEVLSYVQNLWQGAPATMKYNSSKGIQNTAKRNLFNSISYGAAVAYWTTDFPLAPLARDYVSEKANDLWHHTLENPITTGLGALATASIVFGAYELIDRKRENHNIQNSTDQGVN